MKWTNWVALVLIIAAFTAFGLEQRGDIPLIKAMRHPAGWVVIAGFLFNIWVADRIVAVLTKKWTPSGERDGLPRAGQAIGRLERMLVYLMVLLSQYAAIGFLITAKSVFRFTEIQSSQDRERVEYILIGTLLSFSIAIFSGLFVRSLTFGF